MKKSIKGLLVIVLSFVLLFATLITPVAAIIEVTSTVTQPVISWQRSLETDTNVRDYSTTTVGAFVYATAKLMPLTNRIVWDGGTGSSQYFTGYSTRSDISWASWRLIDCVTPSSEEGIVSELCVNPPKPECNKVNVRLFKGSFNIPLGVNIDSAKLGTSIGGIFSPIIPINDNIYVYLNGGLTQIVGGTSHAPNARDASNPNYEHTDGWYLDTSGFELKNALHNIEFGSNVLEVFTEEYNTGGGMSELIMQVETSPIYYTATYYTDCDEETVFTSQSGLTYGADLNAPIPAPTRLGYTFTGWALCCNDNVRPVSEVLDSESRINWWNFDEDTMPDHDITLCAQWSQDQYTVTYDRGTQGAFATTSIGGLVYGAATPSAPAISVNAGYTFTGWSPVPPATVTGSITYTAMYSQNQVIIYDFKQTPPAVPVIEILPEPTPATPTVPVVEIVEEEVAAAPLPKTGGLSDISFLFAGVLFTALGLVYRKKLQKNDK